MTSKKTKIISIYCLGAILGTSTSLIGADYNKYPKNYSSDYNTQDDNDDENDSYSQSDRPGRYENQNRDFSQYPDPSRNPTNTIQNPQNPSNPRQNPTQTRNSNQSYNQRKTSQTYAYDNNKSHESDQDLTKKIQDKIGPGWISKGYDQVTFKVDDGNVTLQGYVKTNNDKENVEREVRNIKGVNSVNSQIKVQERTGKEDHKDFSQDTYSNSADEQLNKKIRDKVSRGWLWDSYKNVTLNTTNGVVTLEGKVDDPSDQQKLMKEIQKVDGVKSVKSNLKFKNNK